MERNFVFLDEVLPRIRWDTEYAIWDNLTGEPVDGYMVSRIMGTKELDAMLHEAQRATEKLGYSLPLWNGYRPQCAVDCFLNWASPLGDNPTKKRYYSGIERKEMVVKGYMASQSNHSYGSAIDLTIFRLNTDALVPMGGDFDSIDTRPHHATSGLSGEETNSRKSLCAIMERSRFGAYRYEWRHYVLVDEPYPDIYSDFCVAQQN